MDNSTPTRRPTSSIVLGTVQFGLPYGVSNFHGKPDVGQVNEILDRAFDHGIRVLDTATAYGESEAVLGFCGMDRWSVITKVPSLCDIDENELGTKAYELALRSLDILGVESLYALMTHDYRDMVGDRGRRIRDSLQPLIDSGRIKKVGVSVYGPKDMQGIDASNTQLVQAPFNVFDQRFIDSGEAGRLKASGGELHVRSVFLQGLLLMPQNKRPARFATWSNELERFDRQVQASGLDNAAFCLGYAARQEEVERCVVGVETAQQLSHLIEAFDAGQKAHLDAQNLKSDDPRLFDPRRWEAAT